MCLVVKITDAGKGSSVVQAWTPEESFGQSAPRRDPAVEAFLIGQTGAMSALKDLIALVAPSDAPVLIHGETGSGKELVARAIHLSSRREGVQVAVNCAAIPAELLESELFGHEKGAFTGADRQRIGYVEQAESGTLFLDEIGELPLALQAKLLRVLEHRTIQRVGGSGEMQVNFRLVSATNRDLEQAVRDGKFRADLYHRLNTFPLGLPPLSARTSDIPLILSHLEDQYLDTYPGARPPAFSPEAVRMLSRHSWPGNVRELRTVFDRACVLFAGRVVDAEHVSNNLLTFAPPDLMAPAPVTPPNDSTPAALPDPAKLGAAVMADGGVKLKQYLKDVESAVIEAVLAANDGHVSHTAAALGIQRTTLIEKIKKLGLRRDPPV